MDGYGKVPIRLLGYGKILIRRVRLDFQGPEHLEQETVERYVNLMRGGRTVPSVTVYFDGRSYWLADGFHRLRASQVVGRHRIQAEIIQGTYGDLIRGCLC